ncbi:MAG TPA: glycosyltransferase family 2 protein [Pyrinomonadaceae bacterium]|nr:glycosyltransferase family 2 protein [Pyrinomonadaceae bacterium]
MLGKRIRQILASYRLFSLPERVDALEKAINELDNELATREEFERLKSSLEVPRELLDEFAQWKLQNPVPPQPLISILVVTYNRARLLTERCLPSLLRQTYNKFELIVVGDRCTDETEELLNKISDPRITFFNLWDRPEYPEDPMLRWMSAGAPAAIKALSMAKGDFITHLDDDDEHLPDRLEKLLKFAVENQCDLVWHPFWWQDQEGKWALFEAKKFVFRNVTHSSVFYRGWFKNIKPVIEPHLLLEPGDWHRFRRIKYFNPVAMRYPEPLLRHYREMAQPTSSDQAT